MATIEPTKFESLEPGIYAAQVKEIEISTHEEYGPQLKFIWSILDEDGAATDTEQWSWCSAKWSSRSKLYGITSTMLKKKCPGLDGPFDTDLLIGKKADIRIEMVKSQAGQERAAITQVYPFRSMTATDTEA